ncbi:MAG: winged helix-turn-helix domain-containing protein [Acidobacteriota bacterium]
MQETASKFRFGSFELDCSSGELRKYGLRLKLEDQPFRLLAALVQRHGEIVDRDVLKSELWAEDTYVDFDRSLTRAINKVRTALGDSAANPLFLETLPRRGYRFVAPVSMVDNGTSAQDDGSPPPEPLPPVRPNRRVHAALALAACLATGAAFLLNRGPSKPVSSIAVLPFQGISQDQNYFGDGMTDQLIATLSRQGSLRVVSHKSVVHYRNTNKKLSDIADELRVDAIVDGSVAEAGGRLRVNARLLQFPGEHAAWSKSYEKTPATSSPCSPNLLRASPRKSGLLPRPPPPSPSSPSIPNCMPST